MNQPEVLSFREQAMFLAAEPPEPSDEDIKLIRRDLRRAGSRTRALSRVPHSRLDRRARPRSRRAVRTRSKSVPISTGDPPGPPPHLNDPVRTTSCRWVSGAVAARFSAEGTLMKLRTTRGAASLQRISQDRKLSPVEKRLGRRGNVRLVNVGPRVSSTYAAISATCTESGVFRSGGCFVQTGSTAKMARAQDEAARSYSSIDVLREEAALINRAYRNGVPQDGGRDGQAGRDLRLHVGGDVGSAEGAELLAEAARGWRVRKGGVSWTYTHWWREVPRSAGGPRRENDEHDESQG